MATLQNKTVGLSANCILIRRDGYESAIEDTAAPIHDRRGHLTGAVIVFHDGTRAARPPFLHIHPAHSATRHAAMRVLFVLRSLGNHHLGREQ